MLLRLFIQNIALIPKMDVEFYPRLNIITGETGSGKSIIIDSINLALGERAERELIKHGESKARVELVFDVSNLPDTLLLLSELGIDPDDGLIIVSRELSASGKSVSRVNGTTITRTALKALTDSLVDIHGQHEHQSLLASHMHVCFLDAYAHESVFELKQEVSQAYDACKKTESELSTLFLSDAERDAQISILNYQIDEIKAASPRTDEEEALLSERNMLLNSERVMEALSTAHELLYGNEASVLSTLKNVTTDFSSISHLSNNFSDIKSRLDDVYYALEDISFHVRGQKDSFHFEPQRLEQIELRLDTLNTLKRKYGGNIASVLAFCTNAEAELEKIINANAMREELITKLALAKNKYADAASRLTKARKEAAGRFADDVLEQLSDLGLSKAKLFVNFELNPNELASSSGQDKIEFMLSANPGEPPRPLAKIASGGEVSRIMLALKAVLSGRDSIPTMIFDEIDTGISGDTAHAVGQKLKKISSYRQIIAITHLPQIAACADVHYLVEKNETNDGKSITSLTQLTDNEHIKELARIMGGSDNRAALEYASALIEKSLNT